jgi:hypothetical protein
MQGELFGMPTSTTTRRRVVYDEPVEHVHEEPTYTTDVHTHPVP